MTAAPKVDVDVDDRQDYGTVVTSSYAALLAATLSDDDVVRDIAGLSSTDAEVGLAFIDVVEMTSLNELHMGGSGPTDVLAFPIDGVDAATVPAGQPALLGDIVICVEVADRAPQGLADELALLVVHGALHLVGHDHREPDETAVMKALERTLLQRYFGSGGAS